MKIAVFHNLPAGGAMRHTFEQVRELARRGYEIHEYTQSTADLSFLPFDSHIAAKHCFDLEWNELGHSPIPGFSPYLHLRQNRANLDRLADQSREIAQHIDANRFDLVFVKDCRYTIAPFVLRYLQTPSIFYMHSDPFFRSAVELPKSSSNVEHLRSWPLHRHERMVYDEFIHNLKSADRVLTNSHFTRDRIRSRHGAEAHVVYPGVDLDTFYPRSIPPVEPYVLSAGGLTPRKGHGFVVESLGMLPEEMRPKLIVATPTAEDTVARNLLEYAASCGVVAEIRTVRDSLAMADLYSAALALLFAPTDEPLGLVALEAMACGTPVIGTAEGGLVETVRDGQTGFLVERNHAYFADAINRLSTDEALRRSYGRNARELIEGFWTWTRAVDDLAREFAILLQGTS